MGKEELDRIKEIFSSLQVKPEYIEHEAVITSEEAAKTRGFKIEQGVKAILFTNGEDWVIVNVPGNLKVDVKKICAFLKWNKTSVRMATQEEVMEKTGCQVGAVPPFGHRIKIRLLVDNKVFDNEYNSFNIGLRTNSAKIKTKELKIVFERLGALEGDFAKV